MTKTEIKENRNIFKKMKKWQKNIKLLKQTKIQIKTENIKIKANLKKYYFSNRNNTKITLVQAKLNQSKQQQQQNWRLW